MLTALILICNSAAACNYGSADDVRQPPSPVVTYEGRTIALPENNPFTVYRFAAEWAGEQIAHGKITLSPGQHIEIKVYRAGDNPGEHKA